MGSYSPHIWSRNLLVFTNKSEVKTKFYYPFKRYNSNNKYRRWNPGCKEETRHCVHYAECIKYVPILFSPTVESSRRFWSKRPNCVGWLVSGDTLGFILFQRQIIFWWTVEFFTVLTDVPTWLPRLRLPGCYSWRASHEASRLLQLMSCRLLYTTLLSTTRYWQWSTSLYGHAASRYRTTSLCRYSALLSTTRYWLYSTFLYRNTALLSTMRYWLCSTSLLLTVDFLRVMGWLSLPTSAWVLWALHLRDTYFRWLSGLATAELLVSNCWTVCQQLLECWRLKFNAAQCSIRSVYS